MPAKCDVFKILRQNEVLAILSTGTFLGSPDDRRDGVIHLSAADQVGGTLRKHFTGGGPLFLLAACADELLPHLVWEPSRGGKLFPHLYTPLRMQDVKAIIPIPDEVPDDFPFSAFPVAQGASK